MLDVSMCIDYVSRAGAAEEDPQETQRLRPRAGVSAGDEVSVFQHQ